MSLRLTALLMLFGVATYGCSSAGERGHDSGTGGDVPASPSDGEDATSASDASRAVDASVSLDAALEVDASVSADAAAPVDAAPASDAAPVDAAPVDATPASDAAVRLDAGPRPDSGPLQLPAYLSGLPPFESRRLATASNHRPRLADVLPTEWVNAAGVGNNINITEAYSGGAGDGERARLYVHGGGHSDSANNGLYMYDFDGTTEPTGWSFLDGSSPSAVQPGDLYADGRPSSVHTYDYLAFDGARQVFLRYAGARWNDGSMNGLCFAYDTVVGAWSQTVNNPMSPDTSGWTVFDPVSRKSWVAGHLGTSFFHRVDANTASARVDHAGSSLDQVHVYDSSRHRALVIGNGNLDIFDIDWAAEAVAHSSGTASGATAVLSETGLSLVYDAAADRVWILLPRGAPHDKIWELDPATFAIVEHSLTGDTSFDVGGSTGSFNRVVFVERWRAIGVVPSIDDAAYVLKLP